MPLLATMGLRRGKSSKLATQTLVDWQVRWLLIAALCNGALHIGSQRLHSYRLTEGLGILRLHNL